MIVPMQKVHLVARSADRQQLLDTLRELGVVHIMPADPAKATLDEATQRRLQILRQAVQILSSMEPSGPVPTVPPEQAAQEVLDIQRRSAEARSRLAALYHQLEQIILWGDVRLSELAALQEAGLQVQVYAMPARLASEVRAECVEVVAQLPGRRVWVAVAGHGDPEHLPPEAELVPWPSRDAPSIRAEAAQIDAGLHQDMDRLHQLAHLVPQMQKALAELELEAEYSLAQRSAWEDEHLFALWGWLPAEQAPQLAEQLARRGILAAVQLQEPAPDEEPPTLVRPPAWARPIEGLFQILGVTPGYRECDVSVPFLIAIPLFTAMLIGDAGYGMVLVAALSLGYRRVVPLFGKQFVHLLLLVGAVTILWGSLTASFFGLNPYPPLIPVDLSEESRRLMTNISFTIGVIHLSLAQFWQGVRLFPHLSFLNKLGWGIFLWGMYGVVRMFVLGYPMHWATPWPYLLLTGGILAILFASPSRNLLKMLVLGLAQFPFSMISTFSDIISYVRLMAVGLAGSVLAVSFNTMALAIGFWPLILLVLVAGHGLNLGLALIAMFAHAVRLNMLEFSNNLGMQWSGYPYRPFSYHVSKEALE
jgi:V/A-type H+-transporting ATPase subunit I